MKTTSLEEFAQDLQGYIKSAQQERILITRNGRPSAVIVGIENKDEEDLRLEASPAFWRMIEESRCGPSRRLKDVEAELFADEK